MNCGIFDGARFSVAPFVDGRSAAVSEEVLLALPFECQTASDAAALPYTMNGFGGGTLAALIVASVRPEATERSSSVTAAAFSRAAPSRCLMRRQLLRFP